jgi:hypothetical protein
MAMCANVTTMTANVTSRVCQPAVPISAVFLVSKGQLHQTLNIDYRNCYNLIESCLNDHVLKLTQRLVNPYIFVLFSQNILYCGHAYPFQRGIFLVILQHM